MIDQKVMCGVCWHDKTEDNQPIELGVTAGILKDPSGRKWTVCRDCIRVMWFYRQAMNQERMAENETVVDD